MYLKQSWGLILTVLLSGCQSITYYSQAIEGQTDIWSKQREIEVMLADPDVESGIKTRLRLALRARRFASETLKLPDNGSYSSYVDLGRDYVVWNTVATPSYSVDPVTSCYPMVGCLSYRGYYKKEAAIKYAKKQKKAGLDVWVGGVTAYSTLGWFDDPLLSTMFTYSDEEMVGLIFHELSHQRLYVKDDTRFNESFATAVEELGLRQWATEQQASQQLELYFIEKQKQQAVVKLILDAREAMRKAYRQSADDDEQERMALKREQFERLKKRYEDLKASGGGMPGFDRFFSSELNNAALALFAEYHGWVGAFEQLFEEQNKQWEDFYQAAEKLAALSKESREQQLILLQSRKHNRN